VVAELPGYARGLALCGRYALVGLSKMRETTIFGSAPLAARRNPLKCGVWWVDLPTGSVAGFVEFQDGIAEISDVQILRGLRSPTLVGFEKETVQHSFVLPESWR
ncbi:MAG: DUF4915 domain-containing protein, partial [Planctomycetota bacterium]